MAIVQNTLTERNVYLTLADVPATGIVPLAVTCRYRKAGQTVLTTKTLDGSNWVEVGNGFYIVRFSVSEMNTQGFFFYTLAGAAFDNFLYDEFTIEPVFTGDAPPPPPGFCVVSGSFSTGGGSVPSNTKITFRPVVFPSAIDGTIVSTDTIVTYLDVNGMFSVRLLQGMTAIVEVDRTGIRHQIEIPVASSANLLDLLPATI